MKYFKKIMLYSLRKNGLNQLLFYLSNLDVYRIIVFDKILGCLYNLEKKQVVLELGSGYSILPKIISSSNVEYVTLDLSKDAALYQKDNKISPVIGDMRYLPFKTSRIPTIIAISSIEHVANDSMVFNEIGRVLKSSGIAILSFPYNSKNHEIRMVYPSQILYFIFNKIKFLLNFILDKHHIRYFSDQTSTDSIMRTYTDKYIDEVLKETGLSVHSSFKWGSDTFFKKFWSLISPGWFVLKDFMFLYLFKIVGNIQNNKNPSGIIIKLVKR